MRFSHPLRIRKWLPVATAMPKMLKVLSQHPELGCLGFQQWFGRTTIMVQYWRDFDSLDRFARDKDPPHLEPWRRFNRAVRDSGEVGIWHETFRVRAGEYEAVYRNMPVFGLAAAGAHVPAPSRRRLRGHGIGTGQEIAAVTSSATFFSTLGLHFFSAYDTGHTSPSSRFAASWKPRVE
jgi:hypothetical protein